MYMHPNEAGTKWNVKAATEYTLGRRREEDALSGSSATTC